MSSNSILIKDVFLEGKITNIYIEEDRIVEIGGVKTEADTVIDGSDKAAIPSFFNAHTHAAMTLFRGYGDDLPLQEWLETKIWPTEAKLTEEDVYVGAKLACLEMIKSGTTFFHDMYWHLKGSLRAADEAGIRAALSSVVIDLFDPEKAEEMKKMVKEEFEKYKDFSERIQIVLGPHAIYTVSKETLAWTAKFAEKHDILIHFHLSETKKEVDDCIEQHGKKPVEYLNDIGFLSERLIACHSVWLNEREIELLAKNNVTVVNNPTSNMKLAVGDYFKYQALKKAGVNICLGTDGCASNNNLDMFEEMKFAALLQKFGANNPTEISAKEVFDLATVNGAKVFRIDTGVIKEGKKADLLLIDLKQPEITPVHDLTSNIVYSANAYCVDTTICDGKILMQNRKVEWESEIIEKAKEVAQDLVTR